MQESEKSKFCFSILENNFEYEELIAFTENGAHINEPNLIGVNK